jgi:hypothetical protein
MVAHSGQDGLISGRLVTGAVAKLAQRNLYDKDTNTVGCVTN